MLFTERTIKDFVVEDFRTAAVFEKYGLDFCCGGAQPLSEACRKKGIDPEAVRNDLEAALGEPRRGDDPVAWDTAFLIDHIVDTHHRYVRDILPVITHHADKVATVHGFNHPETKEISRIIGQVAAEMTTHMLKEEEILFPAIRQMIEPRSDSVAACFRSVSGPIRMMEMEHQSAGDGMAEIRRLSNSFTPPEDACTTYRVLYQELAHFEADLHRHVHLENNILFPRAIAMESSD